MLSQVRHARTPERLAVYQVEPYVVAADVYGAPPHVGRGGWTWYTGSSGWMFRVALESLLGFTLADGKEIHLAPCVPDDWPQFTLTYRLPGEETRYEIVARNPDHRGRGVRSVTLDGVPLRAANGVARLPLLHDGRMHRVALVLGGGIST
jgi:cellobiose phosphorylase